MLFDTHCHLDRYSDPLAVATDAEREGVVTFVMTSLPDYFEMGVQHVEPFKRIRLALGLHPLLAAKHKRAIERFRQLVDRTSYIGEVGLDFSREGASTRGEQCEIFGQVLDAVADRPRFLSVHSRRAEKEVLSSLRARGIRRAVFHWYTGPVSVAMEAVAEGHFFSVNPAMLQSTAGAQLIGRLPRDRVLTETDGPYVHIDGRPACPSDVRVVIAYLASVWGEPVAEAAKQVETNVQNILAHLGGV